MTSNGDRLPGWVRAIDRANEAIGCALAWSMLPMTALVVAVVFMRYGLGMGRVWMQEAYLWLHGMLLMLAAGYTLRHDGHVRIDVLHRGLGARGKAVVDLLGVVLLLLPLVATLLWTAWPWVLSSWLTLETSREAGGLPALFLLKTVVMLFCLLLGLQGLALACRCVLVLRGR